MITLEIDGDAHDFAPGQTVAGRVRWQCEEPPRHAAVRLFWYTMGRGTEDVGIVAEAEYDAPRAIQEERFEFTLPDAPYSFSGKLVALRWAIEALLDKGKEVARAGLRISPWVEEPRLESVKDDGAGWFLRVKT